MDFDQLLSEQLLRDRFSSVVVEISVRYFIKHLVCILKQQLYLELLNCNHPQTHQTLVKGVELHP